MIRGGLAKSEHSRGIVDGLFTNSGRSEGLVHQKLDGIKDCGPLKCGEIGDEETTS